MTPKDGHFLSENKQFDVLRATGPTAEQKKPEELSAEQCDETNDHWPILATAGELFIGSMATGPTRLKVPIIA